LYIDDPVSNLHIRLLSVTIQTSHVPPDGIQPTAGHPPDKQQSERSRVGTGDSRVLGAVWYQGTLWLTFNDGCYLDRAPKHIGRYQEYPNEEVSKDSVEKILEYYL
jgi:hypothetical protein